MPAMAVSSVNKGPFVRDNGETDATLPAYDDENEEGCYLLYESDSSGRLMLKYSRTPVEGAIGFWECGPGKKIQGFKFSQDNGRVEVIRGIAGGGQTAKTNYCSGWCQFLKAARTFNGRCHKFPNRGGMEVDIHVYYKDTSETFKLEADDGLCDISEVDAIAVVPRHNTVFDGVYVMDLSTFLIRGNMVGATTTV